MSTANYLRAIEQNRAAQGQTGGGGGGNWFKRALPFLPSIAASLFNPAAGAASWGSRLAQAAPSIIGATGAATEQPWLRNVGRAAGVGTPFMSGGPASLGSKLAQAIPQGMTLGGELTGNEALKRVGRGAMIASPLVSHALRNVGLPPGVGELGTEGVRLPEPDQITGTDLPGATGEIIPQAAFRSGLAQEEFVPPPSFDRPVPGMDIQVPQTESPQQVWEGFWDAPGEYPGPPAQPPPPSPPPAVPSPPQDGFVGEPQVSPGGISPNITPHYTGQPWGPEGLGGYQGGEYPEAVPYLPSTDLPFLSDTPSAPGGLQFGGYNPQPDRNFLGGGGVDPFRIDWADPNLGQTPPPSTQVSPAPRLQFGPADPWDAEINQFDPRYPSRPRDPEIDQFEPPPSTQAVTSPSRGQTRPPGIPADYEWNNELGLEYNDPRAWGPPASSRVEIEEGRGSPGDLGPGKIPYQGEEYGGGYNPNPGRNFLTERGGGVDLFAPTNPITPRDDGYGRYDGTTWQEALAAQNKEEEERRKALLGANQRPWLKENIVPLMYAASSLAPLLMGNDQEDPMTDARVGPFGGVAYPMNDPQELLKKAQNMFGGIVQPNLAQLVGEQHPFEQDFEVDPGAKKAKDAVDFFNASQHPA